MHTTREGPVVIQVNDIIEPYFKTHKGLRQGDALSLLFDLVAAAVAIITEKLSKNVNGVLGRISTKGSIC